MPVDTLHEKTVVMVVLQLECPCLLNRVSTCNKDIPLMRTHAARDTTLSTFFTLSIRAHIPHPRNSKLMILPLPGDGRRGSASLLISFCHATWHERDDVRLGMLFITLFYPPPSSAELMK